MKKAQVAVYIIVGLIFIIIFVLLLLFLRPFSHGMTDSDESYTIQSYTESCLYHVSKNGLIILGMKGGNFHPENKVDIGFENTTIAGHISEEVFSSELSDYIIENINDCLMNFSGLPHYSIDNKGIENIGVSLNEYDVSIFMTMPLTIRFESSTLNLDSFTANHRIRIKKLISIANTILGDEHYNMDFLQDTGQDISIFTFDGNDQVVIIRDTMNEPYYFAFGVEN